jgi:hypothetical protein
MQHRSVRRIDVILTNLPSCHVCPQLRRPEYRYDTNDNSGVLFLPCLERTNERTNERIPKAYQNSYFLLVLDLICLNGQAELHCLA